MVGKVCVVGLGKLGLPFAACLAYKGYDVVGIDIDRSKVNLINQGKSPIYEPRLQELLEKCSTNLRATSEFQAIVDADVVFIVVNTPSKEDGSYSLDQVLSAAQMVGEAMRLTKKYQVIVLVSTVMPGDTENYLKPSLEHVSGKKCGRDFGLCYNPEFIALGNVIEGLLNPDFVLIGEYDRRCGDIVEQIYKKMCENDPPIERMSIINAEIVKIALNSYITMKITFANVLAEICERYEGADIDVVTRALGRDRRVSPYYLKGGLSYGGPCFPRDNRAFYLCAKRVGCDARFALVTDELNEHQNERVASLILKELGDKGGKVAFLGLSYKPGTDVIEESASIKIIKRLLQSGDKVRIIVYDPIAIAATKRVLGEHVEYAENMEECIKDADLCVIATPWQDFLELPDVLSRVNNNDLIIIDCWRMLRDRVAQLPSRCKYIGLGLYRKGASST